MDDILGAVIWIIIMVVGFYLKGNKNKSENKHNTKEKIGNKLNDFFKGTVDEEDDYLPAYMESKGSSMLDSKVAEDGIDEKPVGISENSSKKKNTKVAIKDFTQAEKEDKPQGYKTAKKEDCNYDLQINRERDIIQGIIFKEILDSPRALKPYRPIYYRRK
ncbi:hypothetical protein [Halocella sp. SP3-1]|uniref:hypothetical protein n=1 Tax=Halocella sp. SP3-1 TaxID=2382161 RepID=UPI000F761569|nr:hypothetical protein [Halocella sp. SP3-1]AZO95008.1 hypothetical protein D7D81_10640 [Halocella sp. SP3-1]MTI61282.1 hypothetical protein [Bacillota bacterium]